MPYSKRADSKPSKTVRKTTKRRRTSKTKPPFSESEIVVAFVGAVGVDLRKVERSFEEALIATGYTVKNIEISRDIIADLIPTKLTSRAINEAQRISSMMDYGNRIRARSKDNAALALGVASRIASTRVTPGEFSPKTAYIVHSLKRPEEVIKLREIYPRGFNLIGVYADKNKRRDHLTKQKRIDPEEAEKLMQRDMHEDMELGQRILETFHLSDFFVRLEADEEKLFNSIQRIVRLLFSYPHCTPSFGEHAMFLAFASSLKSGDLSRQVGAVIARDAEILSIGANDCPKPGGGLYWPEMDKIRRVIEDEPNGRDSARGYDSNKRALRDMIDEIATRIEGAGAKIDRAELIQILQSSQIGDLTEFGRVVHAEMEALLSCARKGISTKGATIYCTTFPCHNCAKHIIASGIKRVVFIEPYPKSKAIKLHDDSVTIDYDEDPGSAIPDVDQLVRFQPFVGVGPRRFLDLFSMNLGVGRAIKRKDENGDALAWDVANSVMRLQMVPKSYLESERESQKTLESYTRAIRRGAK